MKYSLSNENFKRKGIIYGSNYLAGAIGNHLNLTIKGPLAKFTGKVIENTTGLRSSIANPAGGILYGGFDVLRNAIPQIKNSWPVKTIDTVVSAYYIASTVSDLFAFLNGDWPSLMQLPFDVLMASESGGNALEDFSKNFGDLKKYIKNPFKRKSIENK